jgi:hypothetical protein
MDIKANENNAGKSVTPIISAITITFILLIMVLYSIKSVFNYFNHAPKHNLLYFWPTTLIQTSLPKDNYASLLVPNGNTKPEINSGNWKNHLDKIIANIEDNIVTFMYSVRASMLFHPSYMVGESLMMTKNNNNLPNINIINHNISIDFDELFMQELSADNNYNDTFNFTDLR